MVTNNIWEQMRSKFSELVEQGVAAFAHQPIASEMPNLCPICRRYNATWGALTDTHMEPAGDGYTITGTFVGDDKSWNDLLYASRWGGFDMASTGYSSLSAMIASMGMCDKKVSVNGQVARQLQPCADAENCMCKNIKCESYITNHTRIPQSINRLGAVRECFECDSLKEVATKMNTSKRVLGENWFVYGNNIVGNVKGTTVILEMQFDKGVKYEDDMLQELLSKEGIGELYLRQFPKFFAVDSDDKKWQALLRKNPNNRLFVKKFDDLTPVQWMDQIQSIINSIS